MTKTQNKAIANRERRNMMIAKDTLIPQLKKRLDGYLKKSDKNEQEYLNGKKTFEVYFEERFDVDKKINAVFELQKNRIKEQEFSDSQLDVWFNETA